MAFLPDLAWSRAVAPVKLTISEHIEFPDCAPFCAISRSLPAGKFTSGGYGYCGKRGLMLKNCTVTALCAYLLLSAAHAADLHTCKLSADRRLVTVLVSNPYQQETHCTVNCHVQCVSCWRSEEHTSELQSLRHLVCRLLLEKKKKKITYTTDI